MADLTLTIFNQFVDILGPLAAKKGCCFNECDLDYRCRDKCGQKGIDIRFVRKDQCNREHESLTRIDTTNICLDDLTRCDWIEYLTGVAKDFVHQICPKSYVIIKNTEKCRRKPDVWCPRPCHNTTRIVQRAEPAPVVEHREIVTECCECAPSCCERKTCAPTNTTVIQFEAPAQSWSYGDCTRLVGGHEKACCSSCAAH